MVAFARGCLEFLVVWLVGIGILYVVFEPRFSPPGPVWAGGIGGFFVAAAWGLVRNAWLARGQASLIQDSLAGALPRPSRPYAAIGKAVATQIPLLSPFHHHPCVLYSYELSERRSVRVRTSKGYRTESQRVVYLSGLAMTHWAVQTSNSRVPVWGFPVPDQFDEDVIDSEKCHSQIQDFCAETRFERVGKWEVGKILNFASVILRESAGPIRKDLWFDGADEVVANRATLRQCRLIEQLIQVDQSVCVIGKYDQALGGLVNDLYSGGLQVLNGDAVHGIRHLRQTANVYLFFAVISLLVGTLGAYGLLALREHDLLAKQPQVDPAAELLAAFAAEDWPALVSQLEQGVSADSRDSAGRPLLLAAIDRRHPEAIDALLLAGADVNAMQTDWGRRPLEAAFDRAQVDVVERLRSLGATGEFVEAARGTTLEPEELSAIQERLLEYSSGLDQGDAGKIAEISDQWPDDYLESVGRGLYRDTRPVEWTILQGYRRDDLATVLAQGRTKRGGFERYVVTLRHRDGVWKLRRIHWDERMEFQFPVSSESGRPQDETPNR